MTAQRDIAGAVALVTGASRGIGKGIALALARTGVHVAVNYASRKAEAEAVAGEIAGLGTRALALQADVSRLSEVERLVREATAALGPIAILVNNAGILGALSGSKITEAEWDLVLAVNLKSAFLVTEAVLPRMRAARWGRIINLSSIAAQVGGRTGQHYAASKAGLIGLTHSYASLLAADGITCNAIAPALVETDMVIDGLKASPSSVPVGRFGTLEEAGDVAVMLARNGYITGQTINLNGGMYKS
jgi:3-oxoacyl-[acyl-carrier protein] reductase